MGMGLMGNVRVIGSDYYAKGTLHSFNPGIMGGGRLALTPKFLKSPFVYCIAAILNTGFGGPKLRDVTIEQVTEENVKKFGGSAAFGLAGGLLFGPAGMIAGVITGGNKKTHTLIVQTGKGKAVIVVSADVFQRMVGAQFE